VSDPGKLTKKIIDTCGLVTAIATASTAVLELWSAAAPIVVPLLTGGALSPEEFWDRGVKRAAEQLEPGDDQIKLVNEKYKSISAPETQRRYAEYLGRMTPDKLDNLEDAYDRIFAALYAKYHDKYPEKFKSFNTQETG